MGASCLMGRRIAWHGRVEHKSVKHALLVFSADYLAFYCQNRNFNKRGRFLAVSFFFESTKNLLLLLRERGLCG